MFIARHLVRNSVRIASVVGEELRDIDTEHQDLPELLASGVSLEGLATGETTPISEAQLLAPVGAPPAILAVGLNYRAHAEEGGREVPTTPVIFTKHHNCVVGPGAGVHIPSIASEKVDYEGELAIVIGKRAGTARDRATEVIAGYTIMNTSVSETGNIPAFYADGQVVGYPRADGALDGYWRRFRSA